MKKLLWLLLLPAVLSGWIMTPNPGMELWVNDSLRYFIYPETNTKSRYPRWSSDLDAGYGLKMIVYPSEYVYSPKLSFDVLSPSAGYDTIVFYAKKHPANVYSQIKFYITGGCYRGGYYFTYDWDAQSWVISTRKYKEVTLSTSWTKFQIPIKFDKAGEYYFGFLRRYNPSTGADTFYIDSVYVKRNWGSNRMYFGEQRDGVKLGSIAWHEPYMWGGNEESAYLLGLQFIRVSDYYASFVDTMYYPTGLWEADWTEFDSTLKLLYGAGYHDIMLHFVMEQGRVPGMRYYTVGSLTLPYRDDAAFYLHNAYPHIDSLFDAWDWYPVTSIGLLNEKLLSVDTEEEGDSFWVLYNTLKETTEIYFPNVPVTHTSIIYKINEDSSGTESVLNFGIGSYHLYGEQTVLNNLRLADYDIFVYGVFNRYHGIKYIDIDTFPIFQIDEFETVFLPSYENSARNYPFHWLSLPGVIGGTNALRIAWMDWHSADTTHYYSSNTMPFMQMLDSLYVPYYTVKFLAPYQNKKIRRSELGYSPALYCKVEPGTYIISNPLPRDTIEVQLPKAGIARVRWLDPDTQFPIIRTENRSPIYEKTMCVGNRLTIPPGYMYAIEYLR